MSIHVFERQRFVWTYHDGIVCFQVYTEICTGHFQALVPHLSKFLRESQVGFDVSCRLMFVILCACVPLSLVFNFVRHSPFFCVLSMHRCYWLQAIFLLDAFVPNQAVCTFFLSYNAHERHCKCIWAQKKKKKERKYASCSCFFFSLFIMLLSCLLHSLDSPGYSSKSTCV